MKIQVMHSKDVKVVNKPWGYEKWIADGSPNFKYALKEIFLISGNKSSLQFHKYKEETNFIQSGKGLLHLSDIKIDADKFSKGSYSSSELDDYVKSVYTVELTPGYVFHIKPGYIHRVEALTDLTMIESSTIELDDVLRISDDTNRPSGKIDTEHK